MTEEDIFLSPGTIFNKDTHYSLQQERERLSKLLIEARVEIVKLRVGIKEHKKKNPWKSLPREIDKELYNLVEKGGEDDAS